MGWKRMTIQWGRHKENVIGFGRRRKTRLVFRGHDALYISVGVFVLRIVKPDWMP